MKIIAFIAAILSAATVATLAFTTVPSIQKQVEDNAAAIENIQLYDHKIDLGEHSFSNSGGTLKQHYYIHIINSTKTAYSNLTDLPNNKNIYLCDFTKFSDGPTTIITAFFRVDVGYILLYYFSGSRGFQVTSITDTVTEV